MLQIMAIDHLVLRTTQPKKMLAFYIDVLGCTLERETSKATGLTQLRAGNGLIDIVDVNSELGALGGGAPTKTEQNLDHFCLQIKAMAEQDILEHFKKHKVSAGEFTRRYGAQGFGNSIYIQDPDNNTVEIRCQK
ncbi:Catechol 2,3-dioxygenase [Colwellia chukchiensis]|uniref:Catechol 2,3-dioxygenase n=1 Tax=Colwellia chukchiensis TaxID=641665 RepID=A0A1H7NZD0_9GAMM|nr:VOC family protein [Colwellia chukchiensis]SEL28398.1 Catechol 2,3-dioxygenase [Colwellia chukchiensis]